MSILPSEPPVDPSDDPIGPTKPYEPSGADPFPFKASSESQRIKLRWGAAALGLLSVLFLLCMFWRYLDALLHAAQAAGHATPPRTFGFDWHWVFIGSLMIVPATVILLVFSKYIFSDGEKDPPSLKDVPLAQFIEAVIDGIKGVFKKD